MIKLIVNYTYQEWDGYKMLDLNRAVILTYKQLSDLDNNSILTRLKDECGTWATIIDIKQID